MKGKKSRNDFKFVTFIDRFKSDSAASMAVKGLNQFFVLFCFFKWLDVNTDFLTLMIFSLDCVLSKLLG